MGAIEELVVGTPPRRSSAESLAVRIVSLSELFSGERTFRLPPFQRAYAWQTAHVGRLLDNVRDAMSKSPKGGTYQLGFLTLVDRPGDPASAIIDGHQRIMTLTILFAVLRDLEVDPHVKQRLSSFIARSARVRGKGPALVLEPQPILAEFLAEIVQRPGATLRDPDVGEMELSETERNILENRDYLCAALGDGQMDQDTRRELAEFLADRCSVILRVMDDEVEAWRALEIEEVTRVDFNACSRAKASILSCLPADVREPCGRLWEECEQIVGASDMHRLLELVRTIKLRRRSQKPVETDIGESFELQTSAIDFFTSELLPAARRLRHLRDGALPAAPAGAELATHLRTLSWVPLDFWIPVALHWLGVRGEQDAETARFFQRLDRLAWLVRLANVEPPRQERRALELLARIDQGRELDKIPELAIESRLRQEALANLRSPNFRQKGYAALVLRRISATLGEDCGPYDRKQVTFEHIVPRNPEKDRGWTRIFKSRTQADQHINRLGNLTFLTSAENNRAGTLEWEAKREIYRGSVHILARKAAELDDWSPKAIVERTEALIRLLFDAWELEV